MNGWAIVDRSTVLFERTRNMIAQVTPAKKGDLTLISKHIRLKSRDDQMLLMVYLVACLIPDIPHVISVLSGEKGASKTTTMKKIRKLIDPAIKETMVLPKSIDELTLQLSKNYMPSYDNIDHLTHEISDILCMAATGGGISKRELYTNEGEVILTFLRCVVLNGINTVVSRPDIVDRSVISELERIEKYERKDEASLWKEFEVDRPLFYVRETNLKTLSRTNKTGYDYVPKPPISEIIRKQNTVNEAANSELFLPMAPDKRNPSRWSKACRSSA
ncbi:hypothetical protein [Desulfosporosinus sp. HMP52]|uniref:hypothetical protein n=1 Tax=Desulfosporosinus sp. HMP52 TaxID=1487923 RepID=UPI000FFF1813|nr:hypothetical protein [Desulfosporosinus sp. HMP52]